MLIPQTCLESLAPTEIEKNKVGKVVRVSHMLAFHADVPGLIGSGFIFIDERNQICYSIPCSEKNDETRTTYGTRITNDDGE